MKVLKTPNSAFENLPGYSFAPNYLAVGDGLSMHYVEEGPKDDTPVLLLHGEPSWSYLYRKMIPGIVAAGYRVIAPDLIGFGKSDKPAEKSDYTYTLHEKWLTTFVEKMDLKGIHVFCQDWGGLLGLRIAVKHSDRFASITTANTALPTGQIPMPEAFKKWQDFSQTSPIFFAGMVLQNATTTNLSADIVAAYDAPYPDDSYKAGARIFPSLVPTLEGDPEAIQNRDIWKKLMAWDKPFLTLFSDSDPIMKGGEKYFQKVVPGAQGQPHEIIVNGGHFLQEDKGEEIAEKLVAFWSKL